MEALVPVKKTYVAILLDRSGSMKKYREPTVEGFNEQVQALNEKVEDEGETYVTLLTFNSKSTTIFSHESCEALKEMTLEQYEPNGGTAFYDALGDIMGFFAETTNIDDPNNAYLVISISDGEDLNSNRFTRQEIGERIKQLQATDRWTFTFIGASKYLMQGAQEMNLFAQNCASYLPTPAGTFDAHRATAEGITKFKRARASGQSCVKDFYSND